MEQKRSSGQRFLILAVAITFAVALIATVVVVSVNGHRSEAGTVQAISVIQGESRTTWNVGDTFVDGSIRILVTDTNGQTAVRNVTSAMVTGFNTNAPTESNVQRLITITYRGTITTHRIFVNQAGGGSGDAPLVQPNGNGRTFSDYFPWILVAGLGLLWLWGIAALYLHKRNKANEQSVIVAAAPAAIAPSPSPAAVAAPVPPAPVNHVTNVTQVVDNPKAAARDAINKAVLSLTVAGNKVEMHESKPECANVKADAMLAIKTAAKDAETAARAVKEVKAEAKKTKK